MARDACGLSTGGADDDQPWWQARGSNFSWEGGERWIKGGEGEDKEGVGRVGLSEEEDAIDYRTV